MAPRLFGQTSISGVVFFLSKSLLGIQGQKKLNDVSILTRKPPSHVGVKIWNKIPNEFKTLSKDSFNKKMKTTLFQILDSEDSYLDVENISSKLKDCLIKTN